LGQRLLLIKHVQPRLTAGLFSLLPHVSGFEEQCQLELFGRGLYAATAFRGFHQQLGCPLGWNEVSAVASDPGPCASRLQGQGAAPRSIATMVPIVLVPTNRFERSSRVGVGRD
jgi:hypothetical protein